MKSAKYLIIGGGVAGTTAASTIRQHDHDGSILLVSDEPHQVYSRVALPAYTRQQTSRQRVFLKDDQFYHNQRIEFMPEAPATGLDLDEQVVTLADGTKITFEQLLIATGSRPRNWSVPGSQLPGVMSMRTIDDADSIITRLQTAKHVVIVGGGFIALEHIQTVAALGIAATLVVRGPRFWSGLVDDEFSSLVHALIGRAELVNVLYNTEVEEVVGHDQVEGVVLSNGRRLQASMVLTNIGVHQNVAWLQGSGLHVNGGVVTDQHLQSSHPSVYAAGDVAMYLDPFLDLHHHQGNWSNASAQGRIAGLNMVGQPQPFDTVSAYSISLFNTNISFIGQTTAHSSMTVIPRGSALRGAYGRILIKDHRVVGATLINRFAERHPISQLIEHRVDISHHIADLADETISLKDLSQALIK